MNKLLNGLLLGACLVVTFVAGEATAKEKPPIATVKIPKAPELYATNPTPLTPSQCGQCHSSYFDAIKKDGARHQFDCQKCHTVIHAYNPLKGNYAALMPKCDSCHNQPHGKSMTDCATCHTNPHTPKKVAMGPRLFNNCTECHTGPKQQMAQFPSKHVKVGCQKCHTTHGYIPSCNACHKPHYQAQGFDTCTKCHAVHKPLQVEWPAREVATPETCSACHGKIYAKWKASPSRHAKVACAQCHHTKHKFKPDCRECHKAPHPESFLSRYPKCLTCHLDVHDPPTKKKTAK
ncbi:MAG: cytochrome c [Desulfuromonadia bacterium]